MPDYRRPPEQVFNRFKVYRYMASHLARMKMNEQSLPLFKLAEDFARGPKQECLMSTERAKVYREMGELEKARKDVNRALAACPDNLQTHLVNTSLLYAEDEIEDSLITAHVGLRERSLFGEAVRAATGTIENTVGVNAGPMMSMKKLAPTIIKMKKEDLGTLVKPPPLTGADKKKHDALFEMKLKCYVEKYLGPVAAEKEFMQECLKNKSIFTGIQQHSKWMEEILKTSIQRINRKQESLWQRYPLYTYEHQDPHLSKKMLKDKKNNAYLRVAVNNNEAIRQLHAITAEFEKLNWPEVYRRCMDLWRFLFKKPSSLLPNKKVMTDSLLEVMGGMYLSSKRLIDGWSEAQNDERIYYMLGIYKAYNIRVEIFKYSFHNDIHDPKKFIDEMMDYLNKSTDSLEIAVIAHELACAYSLIQNKERSRQFTRSCVFESKMSNHLIWYLNGLFMLGRVELQEFNIREARVTLSAARDLAKIFSFSDAYNFAVRALHLISKETENSLRGGASIAIREKQLLDLMATPTLRYMCSKQLAYSKSLPPHLRMSVLPGVKDRKEAAPKPEEDVSLEAELREEQNIQYMIRQRFTLEPPGVSVATTTSETDLTHLLLK